MRAGEEDMSDKIVELAAKMISGIQSRNAGIVLNLKTRFEQSSAKLIADVKSTLQEPATSAKPKSSSLWFLSRKPWAWKYHDEDEH